MLKKLAISTLALAAAGAFAMPAMAVPLTSVPTTPSGTDDTAHINIHVDPIVSLWLSNTDVEMTYVGSGPNNAAAAASSFSLLNNVPADVSVKATGHMDPDMNLFIYGNKTDASGVAAGINSINGDPNTWGTSAYAPTGALAWSGGDINGATPVEKALVSFNGNHLSALTYNFVYAIDKPGSIPAVTGASTPWYADVTFTIAPQTP